MRSTKIYDIVKKLLEENPILRDSDKKLQWQVCRITGDVDSDNQMSYESFLSAPSMESIRRVRQKIQAYFPHLQSSPGVRRRKAAKEQMKGNFVFQERVKPKIYFSDDGVAYIDTPPVKPVQGTMI